MRYEEVSPPADASFTLGELPAPLDATLHEQLAEARSGRDRLAIWERTWGRRPAIRLTGGSPRLWT